MSSRPRRTLSRNVSDVNTSASGQSKKRIIKDPNGAMKQVLREEEWNVDQYEGRKILVRVGADKEPCVHDADPHISFQPYYFVAWRGFDDSPQEYAECVEFSMSPSDLLERFSENYNTSRKLSRENSVMIPAFALYFLNSETANRIGISPHPRQAEFFPELLVHIPGPINQPSPDDTALAYSQDRVLASSKGMTGRLSKDALQKVSVLGRGIELQESRILGGGRGIYVTRGFALNELITLYVGHIFGERQRLHMQESGIGTHCKPLQVKHSYLDGVKVAFKGMSAAQLVNQGSKTTINCDWAYLDIYPGTGQRVIGIRATRKIFPGEELYVNYGPKFWSEQDYEPTPPPEVILPLITEHRLYDSPNVQEHKQNVSKLLETVKEMQNGLTALTEKTESVRKTLESMLPDSKPIRNKRKR